MSATDKYLEAIVEQAARGDGEARNGFAQLGDLAITCKIVVHPRYGGNRVYWQCNGTRITRAGLKYIIERKKPK